MEGTSKKTALTAYKLILVLFAIGIMVIASLSIIPLLQGGISIEGDPNNPDWRIKNNELIGDTNLTITNSGNFDLENIRLDMDIEIVDDFSLNVTKKVGRISVGQSRDVYLKFTQPINEISNNTKNRLVNRDTDLILSIRFRGEYTYALIKFNVLYEDTLLWKRLVNEISYDPEKGKIVDGPAFVFPVYISTNENDFISGDVMVTTSIYGEDGMKKYSEHELVMELGSDMSTNFTFEISKEDSRELMTNSQLLTARTEIILEGSDFSIIKTEEHRWGAPMEGFEVSNISYDGDIFKASIGFTNENQDHFDFVSRYILYDSDGEEIERTVENHSVPPNITFQKDFEVNTGQETPEEVLIEIVNEKTGYIYSEVYEI